jgi:ATP-dependent DNA ligase
VDRSQEKDAQITLRALHSYPRHKGPSHPDWIHEVKQDGYRLIVSRDGDRVRLFTRNGYDWTSRRIRTKLFVIDGEAVLLGVDGISNFDDLYNEELGAPGDGAGEGHVPLIAPSQKPRPKAHRRL